MAVSQRETYIGQALPRREDPRLVTGGGRYVSDMTRPRTLYMAAVRSPHAFARITGRDASEALQVPGVVGVFGPDELAEIRDKIPAGMPDPRVRTVMPSVVAKDVVRYVGEPVAFVVAENRYIAEDAAERVMVAYEPETPFLDPTRDDGPLLHPELGTNVVGTVGYMVGGGEAAVHSAPVTVEITLRMARVVAHPMEPRAILAEWDSASGELTVWVGTQGVFGYRASLAVILDLPVERIHVECPDAGGGFGVKNRVYPEEAAASFLARRLGRPVKWTGDRREEFLSTNQERDQVHEAVIGLEEDGRIVGVVDRFVQDNGAYTPAGLLVPNTTAVCIPGPYRVPHMLVEGRAVVTNKVPIGPYRGAGRPQATFVMERLLDAAADRLKMSRVEIRRKNLITPEEMPYATGVP